MPVTVDEKTCMEHGKELAKQSAELKTLFRNGERHEEQQTVLVKGLLEIHASIAEIKGGFGEFRLQLGRAVDLLEQKADFDALEKVEMRIEGQLRPLTWRNNLLWLGFGAIVLAGIAALFKYGFIR
jgi:hypothetical protein